MAAAIHSEFAYGKTKLDVRVAGDRLLPRQAASIPDETRAVYDAIEHPIGTAPLRQIVKPGERMAIIVNDITRLTRTDLMLPPIIDTLNAAGIPDRDMFIVFALGIHRSRPTKSADRLSARDFLAHPLLRSHLDGRCEPRRNRHDKFRQPGGDQSRGLGCGPHYSDRRDHLSPDRGIFRAAGRAWFPASPAFAPRRSITG